MRKSIICIILIVCSLFSFISCEAEQKATGSLRITFGDETTRTFAPTETGAVSIDYYDVRLTLSDGKIYEAKNIRNTTLELKDLPIGETHIQVTGYKDGVSQYQAKGSSIFRLYTNDNSVTIPLFYYGEGSFYCEGAFDINKLDTSAGKITFSAEILNPVSLTNKQIDPTRKGIKSGKFFVEYDSITAGIYLIRASIKQDGKVISQHTEAFKIVSGQRTEGSYTFELGGTVENLNVSIVPMDKNVPIAGQIVSKGKDNGGIKDVYEINVTEKPEYVKNSELKYRWIINGTREVEGKTVAISKDDAINDRVFLTVLITGSAQYMMGSATMTVRYDRSFSSSNPDFTIKPAG